MLARPQGPDARYAVIEMKVDDAMLDSSGSSGRFTCAQVRRRLQRHAEPDTYAWRCTCDVCGSHDFTRRPMTTTPEAFAHAGWQKYNAQIRCRSCPITTRTAC